MFLTVFDDWYTVGTNSVPTVYQQSKTVKRQSKQQKWPLVYQSSHVYTESTEYTKSVSAVRVRVRRIHIALKYLWHGTIILLL